MRSTRAIVLLLLLAGVTSQGTRAHAQLAGHWDAHTARPGVYLADGYLAEVYERLLRTSPTFRALADSVDVGQLPVFVGTQQSQYRLASGPPLDLDDSPALARFVAAEIDGEKRYVGGVIIIDVETVRRWHARLAGLEAEDLDQDVAVILAHEFIHVASIATTRKRNSACLDPDRAAIMAEHLGLKSTSCVLEKENRIRGELGLPMRTGYLDPGLRIGDRLDVETMLEEMRLARQHRPVITRVAAIIPRRDYSYSQAVVKRQ